jgi:hypothetical protein
MKGNETLISNTVVLRLSDCLWYRQRSPSEQWEEHVKSVSSVVRVKGVYVVYCKVCF